MKKLKNNPDAAVWVITENLENFLARGKKTAALLDQKKPIPSGHIISFEDTNDLIKFLNPNKVKLVSLIRKKPNSVSAVAKALKRVEQRLTRIFKNLSPQVF